MPQPCGSPPVHGGGWQAALLPGMARGLPGGRGAGPGPQPHALSTQQGRWWGAWQGPGPHPLRDVLRAIPALVLRCQAAGPQLRKGAALLCQTLSDSSLGMAVATMLHGSGTGDPSSIPFPGLLGPVTGHGRSHLAI